MVSRGQSLYTLPVVAAEVLQLTSNPEVDTLALKECIQTDPALTAKILRVVNSSLFGLSREVSDLNQALALLGTKPLKLLVLGFSLPQELFREVAREQLNWYWSTTLARAVAARAISERVYELPGDDAFVAGLLQDIGVLVLLGQLQEPYAKFLASAIAEHVDLRRVEVDSLGFDHRTLTAALLTHWQMPELWVRAIAEPRKENRLAKQDLPHSQLARILHLADLLAELVGNKRLDLLPDLLEVGELYCGMERECLNDLVAHLHPQVKQLSEALSLDLPEDTDYAAVISAAHEQMSLLAESVAEPLSRHATEEESYADVLTDASHLRTAMDAYLSRPTANVAATEEAAETTLPADGASFSSSTADSSAQLLVETEVNFSNTLTMAVGHCRAQRQPVSLILLGAVGESTLDKTDAPRISQMVDFVCVNEDVPGLVVEPLKTCQRALVLPDFDRLQAARFAHRLIDQLQRMIRKWETAGVSLDCLVGAGVASVALPPKNFPPLDLLKTARRCLAAVHSGGSPGVKSLEIY